MVVVWILCYHMKILIVVGEITQFLELSFGLKVLSFVYFLWLPTSSIAHAIVWNFDTASHSLSSLHTCRCTSLVTYLSPDSLRELVTRNTAFETAQFNACLIPLPFCHTAVCASSMKYAVSITLDVTRNTSRWRKPLMVYILFAKIPLWPDINYKTTRLKGGRV